MSIADYICDIEGCAYLKTETQHLLCEHHLILYNHLALSSNNPVHKIFMYDIISEFLGDPL